jgi:hypothetical protein
VVFSIYYFLTVFDSIGMAAGSPGPVEINYASGFHFCISSKVVVLAGKPALYASISKSTRYWFMPKLQHCYLNRQQQVLV